METNADQQVCKRIIMSRHHHDGSYSERKCKEITILFEMMSLAENMIEYIKILYLKGYKLNQSLLVSTINLSPISI